MTVNSKARQYTVTLPENYDNSKPYRLIFGIHWLGGSMNDVVTGNMIKPYYGMPPLMNGSAIFVTMVGVGITRPDVDNMALIGKATFVQGMTAGLNIVLAYSGHITYFGFASELRNPKDFTKSLIMLQTTAIAAYTTVAVVIYYYGGQEVPAPALSAAYHTSSQRSYQPAQPSLSFLSSTKPSHLTMWGMTLKVMHEEGGVRALYRGLPATAFGVAPYVGTSHTGSSC